MEEYKFNDIEKILNGGELQPNFNVNLDGTEKSIYIGMTDKDEKGNVIDSSCSGEDIEQLYKSSKDYLDSLNNFDNYIIWIYSIGALARFLNNYLLNRFKIDELFENNLRKANLTNYQNMIFNSFNKIIIYLLSFQYKFDKVNNEKIAPILDGLSQRMVENFKTNYNKYLKNMKETHTPDEMKKINASFQPHLNLVEFINNFKINKNIALNKFREYVNIGLVNTEIYYLIDYMLDLYITKNDMIQILELLKDTMIRILTNAPKIPKTIKFYKSIGATEKDYKVGQESKQLVVNSVTCSRHTNLGMFINLKNHCCLFEITYKEGLPALFLDYTKTAYGKQMSEVILPPNITFVIKAKEMRNILSYDFKDKENNLTKITNPKPFINLSYSNPQFTEIMVYEVECNT